MVGLASSRPRRRGGLREVLKAGLRCEAARDADAKRIVVEQPSRGSVVASSPPVLPANARQAPPPGLRPHPDRPARQPVRHPATSCAALATSSGCGGTAKGAQQFVRGLGKIRRSRPTAGACRSNGYRSLRATFATRLQERVAYCNRHALGHVQAVIGGTRCGDERCWSISWLYQPLFSGASPANTTSGRWARTACGERRDQFASHQART